MEIKNKKFVYGAIIINLIGLSFIVWIFGYVSKTNSWGIFETITFIVTISGLSFIHLFFYSEIRNKFKIGLINFFPFLIFSFLTGRGEPLMVFFKNIFLFAGILVLTVFINSLFTFLWRKFKK